MNSDESVVVVGSRSNVGAKWRRKSRKRIELWDCVGFLGKPNDGERGGSAQAGRLGRHEVSFGGW